MSDPFSRLLEVQEHKIDARQMQTQKCLEMYRAGIALPDLAIADRFAKYDPVIVGEDGKEMTLERRKELMKGKPPCVVDGDIRKDVDYSQLVWDIPTERLGAAGARNRPGIRVVVPREAIMFLYGP